MIQFLRHRLVFHDRACDQLGKHGNEGAKADDIPLHRCIPPVNIDGIAHGLERKERNANWKRDPQLRHCDAGNQGQIRRQEIPIFEKAKKQQIERHGLPHKITGQFVIAAILLHQHSMGIVNQDGQNHD